MATYQVFCSLIITVLKQIVSNVFEFDVLFYKMHLQSNNFDFSAIVLMQCQMSKCNISFFSYPTFLLRKQHLIKTIFACSVKIDYTFPKPTFWYPTSICQVKFHVENFEELTLIFAYMNNTYTYVVASCAKTCCSRETFSQGLNIAFLLHAYVFTWHEKNMYTLVVKTLIIFFANMLLDILLQGEIYILR